MTPRNTRSSPRPAGAAPHSRSAGKTGLWPPPPFQASGKTIPDTRSCRQAGRCNTWLRQAHPCPPSPSQSIPLPPVFAQALPGQVPDDNKHGYPLSLPAFLLPDFPGKPEPSPKAPLPPHNVHPPGLSFPSQAAQGCTGL